MYRDKITDLTEQLDEVAERYMKYRQSKDKITWELILDDFYYENLERIIERWKRNVKFEVKLLSASLTVNVFAKNVRKNIDIINQSKFCIQVIKTSIKI